MKYAMPVGVGALALSLMIHGGGVSYYSQPQMLPAASASAGVASLGNSFADMVAGVTAPPSPTVEPVDESEVEQPTAPETTEPGEDDTRIAALEPEPLDVATAPPEVTEAVEPPEEMQPEVLDVTPPEVVETPEPPVTPSEPEVVEVTEAPQTATEIAPVTPEAVTATPLEVSEAPPMLEVAEATLDTPAETPELAPSTPSVTAAAEPVELTPVETPPITMSEPVETPPVELSEPVPTAAPVPDVEPVEPVPDVIAAIDENQSDLAIPVSKRPPERPPGETASPDAPPPSAASVANSSTNAVAGEEDGSADGLDAFGGAGEELTPSLEDSQAAAQYGNTVLEALTETEKEETEIVGEALITFEISETGYLVSVEVRESSGNEELDEIAMNHIRRAAPFSPPPVGARRTFSIMFTGRE